MSKTTWGVIHTAILAAILALTPTVPPATAQIKGQTATPTPPVTGRITVYAAASLRDAFTEIGKGFQAQNPGSKVAFSFGGSQQLAEQIGFGAPADVFASANTKLMDAIIKTTRVISGTQSVFVRNRLVVILPSKNPARLRALKDLARPGVKLIMAAKAVPVGQYSLDFLNKAAAKPAFGDAFSKTVLSNVVSYEQDVKAVFAKVALGEADAGIVYSSDAVSDKAGAVTRIDIPDDLNTIAVYPIAPLADSANPAAARAFSQYVLSDKGQTVLAKYGFITKPAL